MKPGAPELADFALAFKVPLVQISAKLREDVDLRARVLQQEFYSIPTLVRLVGDLLGIVQHYASKNVLLIVDDGDKLQLPKVARNVFITHIDALLSLPCWALITFPYWLHFENDFNPVAAENRVVVLENVKVVKRAEPTKLLPAAYGFFRLMYTKLVATNADFVDDEVLREAMLLSAGIPREFIRILQKTFEIASLGGQSRATRPFLDRAVIQLRKPLITGTQSDALRERLMAIHRTQQLADGVDWNLVSNLFAVELTNDKPWYAVHPILAPEVEEWVAERSGGRPQASGARRSSLRRAREGAAMGDALPVLYERNLRSALRLLTVARRGCLVFCVGRSEPVRHRIEDALVARLPRGRTIVRGSLAGHAVRPVARTGESEGRDGAAPVETVLSFRAGPVDERRMFDLNLGREARVLERLRVLLWLDGFEALGSSRAARRISGRTGRTCTSTFSREDFDVPERSLVEGFVEGIDERIGEIDRQLAEPWIWDQQRIQLLTDKATLLTEQGRHEEALRLVDMAEQLLALGRSRR